MVTCTRPVDFKSVNLLGGIDSSWTPAEIKPVSILGGIDSSWPQSVCGGGNRLSPGLWPLVGSPWFSGWSHTYR